MKLKLASDPPCNVCVRLHSVGALLNLPLGSLKCRTTKCDWRWCDWRVWRSDEIISCLQYSEYLRNRKNSESIWMTRERLGFLNAIGSAIGLLTGQWIPTSYKGTSKLGPNRNIGALLIGPFKTVEEEYNWLTANQCWCWNRWQLQLLGGLYAFRLNSFHFWGPYQWLC